MSERKTAICGHSIQVTDTECATCGTGRWLFVTVHDPDKADQPKKEQN